MAVNKLSALNLFISISVVDCQNPGIAGTVSHGLYNTKECMSQSSREELFVVYMRSIGYYDY